MRNAIDDIVACREKINRWTVLAYAGVSNNSSYVWCLCDCGSVSRVVWNDIKRGHSRSCGCLKLENIRTHGLSKTPEYKAWTAMMSRAHDWKCKNEYLTSRYKGRGIRVCQRWTKFENFLFDMGTRPSPYHSLDRIDNDGDYTPDNCRWSTIAQQARNTSYTRFLTFQGKTMCLKDWANTLGLSPACIRYRLAAGWSLEQSLTKTSTRKSIYAKAARITFTPSAAK